MELPTQTVQQAYPELFHYTDGPGIKGIVESSMLWATNISFLNDDEEHIGFFQRRLPHLLRESCTDAVREALKTSAGTARIHRLGGEAKAIDKLTREYAKTITGTSLALNHPYVFSFCRPLNQRADDGLLSQWRGYGPDGGYAIVFDSVKLHELMTAETTYFQYQFATWADVEYYNKDSRDKAIHPETLVYEKRLKDTVQAFICSGQEQDLHPLFEPVIALSCLHKHAGFAEELEVRIVALLPTLAMSAEMRAGGDARERKQIRFRPGRGTMIPYIELFQGRSDRPPVPLPITKVIVGPHPDRQRRRIAAQLMLREYGISAQVLVSDIPYRGR